MSRGRSIGETKKTQPYYMLARKKKVRMFEWITVCAHAYSPSLRRVHACVRALSFRWRSLGHTAHTGDTSQFVVDSSSCALCGAVSRCRLFTYSPLGLVGRNGGVGMHEWGEG